MRPPHWHYNNSSNNNIANKALSTRKVRKPLFSHKSPSGRQSGMANAKVPRGDRWDKSYRGDLRGKLRPGQRLINSFVFIKQKFCGELGRGDKRGRPRTGRKRAIETRMLFKSWAGNFAPLQMLSKLGRFVYLGHCVRVNMCIISIIFYLYE